MVRLSKIRRSNGYWYVRYWLGGQAVDESARTKSESTAERYRVRREMEINAGIQPLKHAEMGALIERYLNLFPPGGTAKHCHEVKAGSENLSSDLRAQISGRRVTPADAAGYSGNR
jgi:hypothetical protein